jgi:hypothetical protein
MSACFLSAQNRSKNAIIMQAELVSPDDGFLADENVWPYPEPPEGWKGLGDSGIRVTGFGTLSNTYKSLRVIRATLTNNSDAPVDIPLKSLSDAKLRSGNSQDSTVAVAMHWRVQIVGHWNWMAAVGWDKPITMILPGRAKAELYFLFPTSIPGDTFSLTAIGEVRIQK